MIMEIFGLLIRSIRDDVKLPNDLAQALKYDISQTYFRREYDQLQLDIVSLEQRIDKFSAAVAPE